MVISLEDIPAQQYTVKPGDSLWAIAKKNNISLDELIDINPNIQNINHVIHPNDKINISYGYKEELIDIKKRQQEEAQLNKDNISAIQGFKHDGTYVIIDKQKGLFNIYDKNNNLLYSTNEISTGKQVADYNTVTYQGNSSLENYAGNNSTPAGILTISGKGIYHNAPSFQRSRFNPLTGKPYQVHPWERNAEGVIQQNKDKLVNDDVASSIHVGDVSTKKSSNGCVRVSKKSLEDMQQFLNVGTRVYTLPETPGSRFSLNGGKLNYVASNPYGNTKKGNISESGHDMVNWDDYNTHIDKSYEPLVIVPKVNTQNKEYNDNVKKYSLSLSNNKQQLQKELNLTSDEYNRLAQIAMGLAEQETKFGTANSYKLKQIGGDTYQDIGQGLRTITGSNNKLINGIAGITMFGLSPINAMNITRQLGKKQANSKGITQIKYDADISNKELKGLYDKFGITKDNLSNPDIAAIATITRLAHIYNNEVKAGKFTNSKGDKLSSYDVLLYFYQGKHKLVKNHGAVPKDNIYIKNVNRFADNFNYYEKRKRRK